MFVTSYSRLGVSRPTVRLEQGCRTSTAQLLTEMGFVLYRNGVIKLNIYFQEYNYRTISESAATTVSAHPNPSGRAGTGASQAGLSALGDSLSHLSRLLFCTSAVMKWMKPPLPTGSQPSVPSPTPCPVPVPALQGSTGTVGDPAGRSQVQGHHPRQHWHRG